jgi:hypothetical protein
LPQIDEEAMNAARLTRRWQEAASDPTRMAEALVDEIHDPVMGLVSRDFLRAELAQLRGELAQLESRLTWRFVTLLGVQIALVGIMVTILFHVMR